MARTFSYIFSDPAGSNITVTTEDNPQTYNIHGIDYSGYAVNGISGTFNNETITGLFGPGGQYNEDSDAAGGIAGPYDNTIFIDDIQGSGGSYYGLDGNGL